MTRPVHVAIRTYQVGFGDCFLLSFGYADASEKHVLVDFGSTKLPEDAPKSRMADIAGNIRDRSGGKLTAIVATHRHQDHISGFARKSGKGPGDIIAGLDPDLVLQPWTEHPDIPVDATDALVPDNPGGKAMAGRIRTLAAMQTVSGNYVAEAKRNHQYLRSVGAELRDQLLFIGQDNIANREAVDNLKALGHDKKRGEYLHAGQATALAKLLDIEIDVLGPPTVAQHAGVRKMRARDPGEYWHLAAVAPASVQAPRTAPLFPEHVAKRSDGNFPIEARWLIQRSRQMRGNQMLQIVRKLDSAMNNTSLILLLRIGEKSLLFPGDAQIENWEYALSQPEWMERLAQVDLYKVGHHGSLNATPKSLWKAFANKSEDAQQEGRLATLLSTLGGKHGHAEDRTEVPRETLVRDLRKHSNLFDTQSLAGEAFWHDVVIDID